MKYIFRIRNVTQFLKLFLYCKKNVNSLLIMAQKLCPIYNHVQKF